MKRNLRARLYVQSLETRTVPATFTVTNLNNNGAGSLRNAILSANGLAGADTVDFLPGLGGTILLTGGDIGITEAVTIQGPGAGQIVIDANQLSRIFTTKNAPAGADIAIIGMRLVQGLDAGGGAILGDDEDVIIQDCAISGNESTIGGGGVYVTGNGRLFVFNSLISSNKAALDGGGACVYGLMSEMYVYNSTITGNTAGGDGGGLYTKMAINNALFLDNCTIVNNSANRGGGFAMDKMSAALASIESTILSNNTAPTGPDGFGGTMSFYYSALGSKADMANFGGDATTLSLLGLDFKLGPIAGYGGPMATIKPAIDSPVRDKGANYSGSTYDNRGVGFPREINAVADIGAVECDPLFIVKNTNDAGFDSLRQQVIDANIFFGPDAITFDATAFATPQTIKLASEIAIDNPITINGPAGNVTLSGENKSRIFNTSAAPSSTIVNFNNLNLTNGSTTASGGAIFANAQIINLTNCHVFGNSASGDGGAIAIATAGNFSIVNSTLSGNTSGDDGGAIYSNALNAPATIRNSTIANNKANSGGGAIALYSAGDTLKIQNSTLFGNVATSVGGAIDRFGGTSMINVDSSVVAGNNANIGPDIYSSGTVNANFSAFTSKLNITTFVGDATTNSLLGLDFKLGVLADNGGNTPTILPTLVTSPLVDAGSNPASLTEDQRGTGFGRVRGAGIDIGAVEYPTNFVVTNTKSTGAGSLRQAVTDADSFTGPDVITFDPAVFSSPATITLGSGIAIDEAVEIQGRGANVITINAAKNGRVFGTVNATPGAKFVISGLRFINGVHADPGGAINIGDENVFIVACEFSDNSSTGSGGAITVNGGNLTVVDSTLANNTSSTGNGGGIHFTGAGNLIVRNSTFSGNKASTNNGGGVSLDNHTGSSAFMNCTFTLNSSFTGGGIGRFAGSSIINIESCIVSGNSAVSGPDIATSGILDAKTSLLGTVAATTFTKDAVTTNLVGKAANLGALADNGGPTRTHRPAGNSPAVNQGSNPFALPFDQRGTGFARSAQGGIDIGAVEAQLPAKVANVIVGDGTAQRSMVTQIKIVFDSIVTFSSTPAAAIGLLRAQPLPITNVTLGFAVNNSSGVSEITLTFLGGSVDGTSLADGRYNINMIATGFAGAGLDGNGDGSAGDNYSLVGSPASGLFRLFGDADGNGTVNTLDFATFRGVFGLNGPSIFDFNADNLTNATDFAQFRARFGIMI